LLPGGRQGYRFATKTWEDRSAEDDPHVPLLAITGRMAAVTSSSADPKRAQGFVVWLSSREASSQVGPHSAATTLFRKSQMAGAGRWTSGLTDDAARQYAEVLSQTLSLPRAFPGLRLPGRLEYLAALDNAVRQAAGGEKPAAEALAEAAKRWQEITEKLGIKEQRRANARSLGQEAL
jgi:ABC-type glycerol-3-phosphate transport system substrate-binding protein